MYCSALDYWYKKGKEYSFSLTCSCGKTMKVIVGGNYESDKLHCTNCGLVWEVKKPCREEE